MGRGNSTYTTPQHTAPATSGTQVVSARPDKHSIRHTASAVPTQIGSSIRPTTSFPTFHTGEVFCVPGDVSQPFSVRERREIRKRRHQLILEQKAAKVTKREG